MVTLYRASPIILRSESPRNVDRLHPESARNQPLLPMGLGYVEGVTHNYARHGTTTLFAVLNLSAGNVIGRCQRRHRHQEYLYFLKQIDTNVPKGLAGHLIVGNYTTHKHPRVQRWLAEHPRVQVHFALALAFWLKPSGNLVSPYPLESHSPRHFRTNQRTRGPDRALCPNLQFPSEPVYLDRHGRLNPPKDRTTL
jgi:transposase